MGNDNKAISEITNGTGSTSETALETTNVETKIAELRCPNCQALINEDVSFCPECGASLKLVCLNCGKPLESGRAFCPDCGSKMDIEAINSNILQYNQNLNIKQVKTQKHKKLKIVMSFILVFMIAIGGYFGYVFYNHQQVLKYALETDEYIKELKSTQTDLSLMNSEWEIVNGGYWLYYGTMKSYARSICSTNLSNAKTANAKIIKLYDKLNACEIKNQYVIEIKASAIEIQNTYLSVYESVIVDESGYNSSKLSNLSNSVSKLESILSKVKLEYGDNKKEDKQQ